MTYLIIENHKNNLEMDLEFDKAEQLISLHLNNLIHFFHMLYVAYFKLFHDYEAYLFL